MWSSVRCLLVASLACGWGCGAARRTGEVVQGIRFDVEGRPFPGSAVGPRSNRALRRAIDQERTSVQSMVSSGGADVARLDPRRQEKDARRLEVWFAEHGYFDVRFERWETRDGWFPFHGRDRRPVVLVGHILPGEPSKVRRVAIHGVDDLKRATRRRLRASTSLVGGRVFSSHDYTSSLTGIRSTLLSAGYAFAVVDGSADAYPDERAVDVRFDVVPGPRSRFGEIRIEGTKDMPASIVAAAVTFESGDRFHPRELADTRAALFGLRVFWTVDVTPDLSHPESATVPVLIRVKGAKTRRLKVGPGVELESGKGGVYAAAEWEDTNVFDRLVQFEQSAKVGVAGVVAQRTLFEGFTLDELTIAPVVDATTTLEVPHIAGPDWSVEVDGRVQTDIDPGYRYFSPEIGPALAWRPREHLSISFGYRIKYFDYFAFTVDVAEIEGSPLGLDLTDPYLLSKLEQQIVWDGRNSPTSPSRGWYAALSLDEAGGPVFGNFRFVRTAAEVRTYRSLSRVRGWNPGLIFAGRLGGGWIAPYGRGEKASVPYSERLYLGGGATVRGWAADRLGPRVIVTSLDGPGGEIVPAGGLLDTYGNLEARKVVAWGFSVVGFGDVGQVWAAPRDFAVADLQWSAGGGLRYATPIGPLRGDVGVRLGPDRNFRPEQVTEQARWAVHFGLSEAF